MRHGGEFHTNDCDHLLNPTFVCSCKGTKPSGDRIGEDRIGDAKARKAAPVFSGVVNYFPDALIEVAILSRIGNEQHNPGEVLHWAKEKSTDEKDALLRHLIDAGTRDTDGVRHSTKVAWRALANLQREIDAETGGGVRK